MLQKLIAVLPPPLPHRIQASPPAEWEALFSEIGNVPDEYTIFVRIYGFGSISSTLRLFAPLKARDFLDHANRLVQTTRDHLREFWDTEEMGAFPYDFYPALPGLFPFACTVDMDILWWHTVKEHRWPIVVTPRSTTQPIQRFNLSFWSFLYKLLTRQIAIAGWRMPDPHVHPPRFVPGE
jgi:hypothetical protein